MSSMGSVVCAMCASPRITSPSTKHSATRPGVDKDNPFKHAFMEVGVHSLDRRKLSGANPPKHVVGSQGSTP